MRPSVLVWAFLLVFLLAACAATDPAPGLAPPADLATASAEDAIQETAADPTPEQLSVSPTPSPLFEQDYGPNPVSDRDYSEYELVTLLPPDAIPALDFPAYYSVSEANREYMPEELVIGVEFNGDARAYAVGLLSRHEIVNDTVGGVHLSVTW
jgi:hypothetical protein